MKPFESTDGKGEKEIRPETLNFLYNIIKDQLKKAPQSKDSILLQEKLIMMTMVFMDKNPQEQLDYDFQDQVIDFVQKTNKIALSSLSTNNSDDRMMISKAFDLLFNFRGIKKGFKDKEKYTQCKVLTFNNLSCIYKQQRKYPLALKAVTNALVLEQKLIDKCPNTKKEIISTYLNRSSILSLMKRHQKSITVLKQILEMLRQNEEENQKNMQKGENLEEYMQEEKELEVLKMYTYFNLGAQHEYLKQRQSSIDSYFTSLNIAKKLNDNVMRRKCLEGYNKAKGFL